MGETKTRTTRLENLSIQAGALSLAAGFFHMMVTREYFIEWWGYGFFFIFAALAQLMYGLVLLLQPWKFDESGLSGETGTGYARPIFVAGLVGNLAIVVLYLITRSVGVPLGPNAGTVLSITPLSAVSKAIELLLIGHLIALIRRVSVGEQGSAR